MTVYVLLVLGHVIAVYATYGDALRDRNIYYPEGKVLECNVRPKSANAIHYEMMEMYR